MNATILAYQAAGEHPHLRVSTPGDEHIARAVAAVHRRRCSQILSTSSPTGGVAHLTATELGEVFGPQWQAVIVIVRTLATTTPRQLGSLAEAGIPIWHADGVAEWDAAAEAAGVLPWVRNAAAAAADAPIAARATAWAAVRASARAAARAYAIAHLVDQPGFGRGHFELLSAPYLSVFGDPMIY